METVHMDDDQKEVAELLQEFDVGHLPRNDQAKWFVLNAIDIFRSVFYLPTIADDTFAKNLSSDDSGVNGRSEKLEKSFSAALDAFQQRMKCGQIHSLFGMYMSGEMYRVVDIIRKWLNLLLRLQYVLTYLHFRRKLKNVMIPFSKPCFEEDLIPYVMKWGQFIIESYIPCKLKHNSRLLLGNESEYIFLVCTSEDVLGMKQIHRNSVQRWNPYPNELKINSFFHVLKSYASTGEFTSLAKEYSRRNSGEGKPYKMLANELISASIKYQNVGQTSNLLLDLYALGNNRVGAMFVKKILEYFDKNYLSSQTGKWLDHFYISMDSGSRPFEEGRQQGVMKKSNVEEMVEEEEDDDDNNLYESVDYNGLSALSNGSHRIFEYIRDVGHLTDFDQILIFEKNLRPRDLKKTYSPVEDYDLRLMTLLNSVLRSVVQKDSNMIYELIQTRYIGLSDSNTVWKGSHPRLHILRFLIDCAKRDAILYGFSNAVVYVGFLRFILEHLKKFCSVVPKSSFELDLKNPPNMMIDGSVEELEVGHVPFVPMGSDINDLYYYVVDALLFIRRYENVNGVEMCNHCIKVFNEVCKSKGIENVYLESIPLWNFSHCDSVVEF
jgi:hypothetical protein